MNEILGDLADRKGTTNKKRTGWKWLNNAMVNRIVSPDKIPSLIAQGWKMGTKCKTA
jgi:hypothetical protein